MDNGGRVHNHADGHECEYVSNRVVYPLVVDEEGIDEEYNHHYVGYGHQDAEHQVARHDEHGKVGAPKNGGQHQGHHHDASVDVDQLVGAVLLLHGNVYGGALHDGSDNDVVERHLAAKLGPGQGGHAEEGAQKPPAVALLGSIVYHHIGQTNYDPLRQGDHGQDDTQSVDPCCVADSLNRRFAIDLRLVGSKVGSAKSRH